MAHGDNLSIFHIIESTLIQFALFFLISEVGDRDLKDASKINHLRLSQICLNSE